MRKGMHWLAAGLLAAGAAVAQPAPKSAPGLPPPAVKGQPAPRQAQPMPPPRQAQPAPPPRPAQPAPRQAARKTPAPPLASVQKQRPPLGPGQQFTQRREAAPPAGPPSAAPAPVPAPSWPALPPRAAQEPPALVTLRGLLDAGVQLGYREARQEGEVLTLLGADLRKDGARILMDRLVLEGLSAQGLRRGEARGVAGETPEGPFALAELDLEGLAMLALRPGQGPGERDPDQITLQRLRLGGFAFRGDAQVGIERLLLADWHPGRPSRLEVEGIEIAAPGQPVERVRLARAGVEGFDFAALMAAAVRSTVPPQPPAGRQVLRVEGLALSRGNLALGGIGRLQVEGDTAADGASRGRLTLRDATLERFPEVAEVLDGLGLPRLGIEMTLDAAWTPRNARFELPALAFGVRDLGALAIGWVVEGFDPQNPAPDPSQIRVFEARLRYADQSLYERAVREQARRERTTEERVRQQHAQMVGGAFTGPRPDPALDAIRDTLLRFVRGQAREVEFVVRPPRPVTLAEVQQTMAQGPAAAVRALGLSAAAR